MKNQDGHSRTHILEHPIEKRGFVSVPLDHNDPSKKTIEIFYRLIPSYGGSPDDKTKPIIVVFNGGPGVASHFYRPLNFDYDNLSSPKNGWMI